MSLDDTTYDLIDQYLQGELPNDHPFVQQLLQDKDLALEVEVRKMVATAVVEYRLMEVEKLVINKRKAIQRTETSSKKWGKLTWPLLAVVGGAALYFYAAEPTKEIAVENTTSPVKENAVYTKAPETVLERQPATSPDAIVPVTTPKVQKATQAESVSALEKKDETNFSIQKVAEPVTLQDPEPISTVPAIEQKMEEVLSHKSTNILPVDPCMGIRMRAYIEEQRPCLGNRQGQLTLKGTRGGKAPYQYSIEGKAFQEENRFEGLAEGEYTLAIKDANGCTTTVYEKFSLRSKSCASLSEHVFNPHLGSWEVANLKEKQGSFTIFDLNGQILYSKSFDKGEKVTWGGTRNSGELLAPAAYLYSIKYSDGEIEQGKITLTY